jgi:adenosine deaminase
MLDRQSLSRLPKVELHRHLDGSVRFQTILSLARRHGLDLGSSSEEELRTMTLIRTPMRDLEAVIASFAVPQKVLCCYEALRRVAFENVEDAYQDGVKLLELRFAPAFISAGKSLTNDEIIEGVLDGVADGAERYPIEVGLIGILPRTAVPEANRQATADLIRYARGARRGAQLIVGFDLADSETAAPAESFVPLVDQARRAGLGITIHSGENTSAAAVRKTLELFHPDRIGHGIRIWEEPQTVERVRQLGVHLEICPTSNWLTRSVPSRKAHPLPGLYRAGVSVSVNSDDPQLMDIDLVHEYELCTRFYGFGPSDFQAINRAAARASFLPEAARRRVLAEHFSP